MRKISTKILVFILFISTLFTLFTGDEKGILFPYGLIEIGIINELLFGSILLSEFIFLLIMLAIQFQLFCLLYFKKRVMFYVLPSIFLIGFLMLNFYDLKFKDYINCLYSLTLKWHFCNTFI